MAGTPSDPTLKTLVEVSPEGWPELVHMPGGPTDVIDADIATVSGAGDKVLRVHAEPPYLLHLEFHSGHDAVELPEKMHVRSVLLHKRHQLLVHSVAVVLHPGADSPTLKGLWKVAFPGKEPYDVFRYQVMRVWQVPPEQFLNSGAGLFPLAPISGVTEAELPGIIQHMHRRLRSRDLRPHAETVWAATNILLGLRYPPEVAESLLQGVRGMRESATYQAILNEGRTEEARNEERRLRRLLRVMGQERFGNPGHRTDAVMESITDRDQLEQLLLRMSACQSWEELFKDVAPRRATRRRSH